MIKRMIILIVMGLTLSSCQLFTEAIKDNKYILLYYNNMDKDLNAIAQKIIKANGLTNTCK